VMRKICRAIVPLIFSNLKKSARFGRNYSESLCRKVMFGSEELPAAKAVV